jgi:hypothetical protein
MGGNPLSDSALGKAIDEDRKVGVRMHVNKAGRNKAAVQINDFLCPQRMGWSDFSNSTFPDSEVTPKPGISAAIQNPAIGEYNVESCHEPTIQIFFDAFCL